MTHGQDDRREYGSRACSIPPEILTLSRAFATIRTRQGFGSPASHTKGIQSSVLPTIQGSDEGATPTRSVLHHAGGADRIGTASKRDASVVALRRVARNVADNSYAVCSRDGHRS